MKTTELQPLVNKTVEFAYRGARLSFDLSHALFSSFSIDTGTRLLLKEIAHDEVITSAARLLDAGCGTGIIGISLAASCPAASVVMRDRDLLACAFSERNCWRNAIPVRRLGLDGTLAEPIAQKPPRQKKNAERTKEVIVAPGLLGEDDPLGPYDAVVSNVPAKAGPAILSGFVATCGKKLLKPGGRLAFVIVNTLSGMADAWCASSGLALVKKAAAKSHTVFVLEKPKAEKMAAGDSADSESAPRPASGALTFEDRAKKIGFYVRSSMKQTLGRYAVKAEGYWGLPEFDTVSYATELAIEALSRASAGDLVRNFLIAGSGTGLPALWARKALGPQKIYAISRDLLSLFATKANLEIQGMAGAEFLPYSSTDTEAVPSADIDCALWFPDEIPEYDSIAPAWAFLHRTAKKGAAIVIVASSTTTARFERCRPQGIQRLGEKKKKGFSALMAIRSE